MSSAVLERTNQVLEKLVQTFNIKYNYVDEYYPWSGVLEAAQFTIFSILNGLKGYSMFQLVFFRCMILLIKNKDIGDLTGYRIVCGTRVLYD